jgi:hypothetical protein
MAIGKYRRAELAQVRNKGLKHPAGKKTGTVSGLNKTKRKRKPSFSSISTISSVSGFEEDDQDEADSEASSDEDDESAHRAPSYGGKSRIGGRKTGSKIKSSLSIKKRKLSYDEGYEGQQSSAGDSDSDYAAVDEISDDDEDIDVEKLEEQMILESESEGHKVDTTFSTTDGHDADEWAGFGSFDDHILFSTEPLLEDHLYSAMETFGETDFTSEAVETPVQRHVHFVVEENDADSDSSSDSRDGSTDDEIPGDFLQQDSLDPTLRRMIDNDYDTGSNQRYEDIFGESDFSHPANIYHVESDAVSNGSSGYESMLPKTRIFPFCFVYFFCLY